MFRSCNLTQSNFMGPNNDLTAASKKPLQISLILGFISILSGYIRVISLNILAERQSRTIRKILFRSILKKDIVYFDKHETGELNVHFTENINKIRDGMGDKLGSAIEMISTSLTCFIIGKSFVLFRKKYF